MFAFFGAAESSDVIEPAGARQSIDELDAGRHAGP